MTLAAPARPSGITSGGVDVRALKAALDERVDGEIRFDDGSRAAYSTDASNYRQVPIAVVVPHSVDAGVETVRVCHELDVPLLSRGGGTSLAGQCCNTAVVIDWSKYCTRLVEFDPDRRTAVVEPGIVLDELNRQVAGHGLMYGPRPATHSHCTIGGMIGNNSCGSSAQAYGKTSDNVRRLEVLTFEGERMWVGPTNDQEYQRIQALGGARALLYRELKAVADEYGDDVRRRFPDIPRRVSGYNLDALLPERGFDVAAALIGSESTLVTVLHAELDLVPVPNASTQVVLGYDRIDQAGDVAALIAGHDPQMVEGMDSILTGNQKAKNKNVSALELLPDGEAWLVVEIAGVDQDDANRRANGILDDLDAHGVKPTAKLVDDPAEQKQITAVREAGLGATSWLPGQPETWSGWEDAAVPPERLGDYLRDFRQLLNEYHYDNVSTYGHFGQGCVHCRIPFDLASESGIDTYDRFIHAAAELVARYGGSFSGEHGDGQSRGALLPIMFGTRVVRAFDRVKRLFDPGNRMNPGKIVHPNAPTADLRLGPGYRSKVDVTLGFSYPAENGSFGQAALRCVGVGNCRSHSGGVMCPSYRATGEEEHSTRGRSRLLFEMLQGNHADGPITDGWRSSAVKDALDLCLSCKGCRSDCPVDVDMATYKAEFLYHHYARRIRPAAHYSMGWLPLWSVLAHAAPTLVNRLTHTEPFARIVKRVGGVQPERPMPVFARHRFTDWFRDRPERPDAPHGDVMIWPDSFTNNFHPAIGRAAVRVLEDAGYRVRIPDQTLCCALTWISTGQLGVAKRILKHTARTLADQLGDSMALIGLEPSCTAVFRSDGPELLPDDDDVALLKQRTRTLAEVLRDTPGYEPPAIDRTAVVQPHCHQHAVMRFDADRELMDRMGLVPDVVGGCCGLAGNFGFEDGHLDVSVACAEHELLPAVRGADPTAVIVADGFSCRTQLDQTGEGRRAVHLAELIAAGLDGLSAHDEPERDILDRPGRAERIPSRVLSAARSALPGRRS